MEDSDLSGRQSTDRGTAVEGVPKRFVSYLQGTLDTFSRALASVYIVWWPGIVPTKSMVVVTDYACLSK